MRIISAIREILVRGYANFGIFEPSIDEIS